MKRCFIFTILVALLLSSCATTLKMNVTRPAELDIKDVKTIGVLPFSQSDRFPFYSSGASFHSDYESYAQVNNVERQVLNYIQSEIEKGIMSSPYVELVSSNSVKNGLKGKYKNPSDIYISGEMVTFNIFDEEKSVKKEIGPEEDLTVGNVGVIYNDSNVKSDSNVSKNDNKKNNILIESFFTREVLLVFNYQVVESDNHNVLYFDTLKINQRCDPVNSVKELPDPYSMIFYDLQDFVYSFLKKIQPYSMNRNVTLLNDKSKNPKMEQALKLAKNGSLKESYNIFYELYEKDGIFEAGYNSAMILMVIGDFQGAESLMKQVYYESGNVKASEGLSDIMNEIRQNKRLKEQIGDNK